MRKLRLSIAALMGAVLVAALGLAVFRYGSQVSAGVLFLLTCGMLCLGIVGIVCRGGGERAWWLGFTLFGWGYMALAFRTVEHMNELPTTTLLFTAGLDPSYARAGHCCWALLAAVIGGVVAWTLFGGPARGPDRSIIAAQGQELRGWWRRPAVTGLVAFVLVVLVAVAGARLAPGLWAGAIFLLTCTILAFSALGALWGRGRSRQVWLGASLFGAGYMVLTFGRSPDQPSWPSIPPTTS